MKHTLGKETKTSRGFRIVKFKDIYGEDCSLQASSLAVMAEPGTSAVWLGCDDAQPKVMASKAASVGVLSVASQGWVPYPIPDDVSLATRMHLDREQVQGLIGNLQYWLRCGRFTP